MNEYGIWPFDTLSSWLADDTMVAQATAGVSADPSVYDTLDERLLTPPPDTVTAYEQAAYFLAIGARRADYEGNKGAQSQLYQAVAASLQAKDQSIGVVCRATGFMCRGGGRVAILQNAISEIEASSLNQDDKIRLTQYLRKLKRATAIRSAVPLVILFGVGAGATYWWYRMR